MVLVWAVAQIRLAHAESPPLPPGLEPLITQILAGPEDLGVCTLGDVAIRAADLRLAVVISGQPAHLTLLPQDGTPTTDSVPHSRSLKLVLPADTPAGVLACAQAVMRRVNAQDDGSLLARLRARPEPPQSGQPAPVPVATPSHVQSTPPPPSPLHPLTMALLFVILPIATGALLGLLAKRGKRTRLVAVVPLPILLGALLLGWQPNVAFWDLVLGGSLCTLTASAVAWSLTGRRLALIVATVALATLATELAVRALLPPPPTVPDAALAQPVIAHSQLETGCATLFEPVHDPEAATNTQLPTWVHLGDSMVAGNGVTRDRTFVAELNRLQHQVFHLNVGSPGTTMDTHWLWLKLHLARVQPARVVVHTLILNDVAEMDRPYTCCNLGPLLSYPGDAVEARCLTPVDRVPLSSYVARSPAPYPIRVAAGWSWLARLAVAAASQVGAVVESRALGWHFDSDDGSPTQWAHYREALAGIVRLTQNAGIPLTLVVLPSRLALESPHPEQTVAHRTRLRIVALAKELGVDVLDGWPLLAEQVRAQGGASWFVTPPAWDPHFSERGHALVASWLWSKWSAGDGTPARTGH